MRKIQNAIGIDEAVIQAREEAQYKERISTLIPARFFFSGDGRERLAARIKYYAEWAER